MTHNIIDMKTWRVEKSKAYVLQTTNYNRQNFAPHPIINLSRRNTDRFARPTLLPNRHPFPCLRPRSPPHEIEMQNPLHRDTTIRTRPHINRRIRTGQKHVLLHEKLGVVFVGFADHLTLREGADELGHVAVVGVIAGALEDLGPVVEFLGGLLGQDPVHVWFRAAHAGVEHERDAPGLLEQARFLHVG